MKIIYLKLKNFASIYAAMNRKEISIDLSKSKNTIVVFEGPNGSGKTSILSMLHPFAYVGNLDIRSNSDLILENEDGYKEIHILHKSNLYKIQHYYKNSATRGITLKSFIQKNGTELNPNGNVTSFNDCVRIELSLEIDFLRLIRLGSNVNNLIDLKSTDRKNYAAYLLSDINVYTSLFKKINEDNRLIKNLMKTVNDKLEKLQIVDIDLSNKEILELENKLVELNELRTNAISLKGSIEGSIQTIAPDGVSQLISKQMLLQSNIDSCIKMINNSSRVIDSLCIVLSNPIDIEIEETKKLISVCESKISSMSDIIIVYKEQLSDVYNERDKISSKISTLSSDVEYSQITTFHLELKLKIKEMKKKYEGYIKTCTKEEYIMILNTITQINSIMSDIYGFNNKSIKKTIELMRNNVDVETYVNKELGVINKKMLKITSQFKSGVINNPLVIFKPSECDIPECPYLYLYDLLFSNEEEKDSLSNLESEHDMLNDILSVHKNISYIFMTLKSVMNLIVKGQFKFLSIENIFDTISNGSLLDYEDYITNLISDVEEYDSYMDAKVECKKIEDEIKLINANKGNIDELTSQLKEKDLKIAELMKIIKNNEDEIKTLESKKDTYNDFLNEYLKYKSCEETIDSCNGDLEKFKSDYEELSSKIIKVNKLVEDIKDVDKIIQNKDWEIDKITKDLINKKFNIKEFENLTEEQSRLNEQFDDIAIIKETLSSSKGVPLLYIQLYLKNTKMYVNDLLEKIYDNFEIDDFDINESEFNIPYIKNGIRIGDVAYASQGEKSFLTIAISFALITQSIKDYNILLLDEVDSTLDVKNRAMFLTILENWIDVIGAEQVFLITHNNMFDNYPVDVISTSKTRVESYNNANVIFSL